MHISRTNIMKKSVYFFCLASALVLFLFQFSRQVAHKNQVLFSEVTQISAFAFFVAALFALIVTLSIIALSVFTDLEKETLYLIGFLFFGILYVFAFAPTASPDEPVHFKSAYYVSNLLCCPVQQLNSAAPLMRSDDYFAFTQLFSSIQSRENYLNIIQNFQLFDHSIDYIEASAGIAISNAPLGYVFSGLGITIGRMLHLGSFPVFYLGRIFNVIAYALMTYFAMKRTPIGKNGIFVISFLPMTLNVTASFSYDCYAIAFSMLFLSEILRAIYTDDHLTKSRIVCLSILGCILAITKVVYIPLLLAILLIPDYKIDNNIKKSRLIKISMLLSCGIVFIVIFLTRLISSLTAEELTYTEEQGYTISWVLHNIIPTIGIFLRTLIVNRESYFLELIGFSLGWFQIWLDTGMIYLYAFVLLICFGTDEISNNLPKLPVRVTLLFSSAAAALLVLASMFFAWTPLGSPTILGVQGRYFLPLVFPLCIIAQNSILRVENKYMRYLYAAVFALSFSCILDVISISYSYIP